MPLMPTDSDNRQLEYLLWAASSWSKLEGSYPTVGGETDFGVDSNLFIASEMQTMSGCQRPRLSSSSDLLGLESLEPLVRLAAP